MDARKFASKYIKPDSVRDGAIETRIINVYEDAQYSRLMIELETGSQFGLNDSNTNRLIQAWGSDTNNWIGQELALELGTYKDWREGGVEKETVRVRAISPANAAPSSGASGSKKPVLPPVRKPAPGRDDMDDQIPF
jgi:hypothetical protein